MTNPPPNSARTTTAGVKAGPPLSSGPEQATRQGRLGLSLSGGGFRAAFFHVGILAQLAERGVLRHVEVISTVSGGSIVGALYYLHVKRLLESRPDAQVRDADYVEIVKRVEGQLLQAVERNFRVMTFRDIPSVFKMRRPDYSRSDRIGELYDKHLYRPVLDGEGPVRMKDLLIQPPDGPPSFRPLDHNGPRKAKVPILRINATSLNTGHSWRFEATRMGESPPGPARREIDNNAVYERAPAYDDVVERQKDFGLGHAVAASAAVPLVFPPLSISQLHDPRVQLVDGGVHDNQGLQGILDPEMGCTRFIVSDASGQLEDQANPGTRARRVLQRVSSIQRDRMREEPLIDLREEHEQATLIVHLRKGIPVHREPYRKGREEAAQPMEPWVPSASSSEAFGIHPKVQDLLSRIRTDLDSFTEVEAFSLAWDGYAMCGYEITGAPPAEDLPTAWQFAQVREPAKTAPSPYTRQLEIGSKTTWKIFRLDPALRWTVLTGLALLATACVILASAVYGLDAGLLVGGAGAIAAAGVLAYVYRRRLLHGWAYAARAGRFVGYFAGSWLAGILTRAWTPLNRRFLTLGRVERVLKRSAEGNRHRGR